MLMEQGDNMKDKKPNIDKIKEGVLEIEEKLKEMDNSIKKLCYDFNSNDNSKDNYHMYLKSKTEMIKNVISDLDTSKLQKDLEKTQMKLFPEKDLSFCENKSLLNSQKELINEIAKKISELDKKISEKTDNQ
jgi:hypothetical protein